MNIINQFTQVNTVVVTIFGVSIWGVVKILTEWFCRKYKQIFIEINVVKETMYKRLDSLDQAQLANLHTVLLKESQHYLKRGWVRAWELEDLVMLFVAYKNLGGNGTVELYYKDVLKLPKRSDDDGAEQ